MIRVSTLLRHIYPNETITVLNDREWVPSLTIKELQIQGSIKISKAMLNKAKSEIQDKQKREKYKAKRREEYLEIQDQLDLLYHDMKNGTSNWVDAIDKIKKKHPKPE